MCPGVIFILKMIYLANIVRCGILIYTPFMNNKPQLKVIKSSGDYRLLDCGMGEKLEQFGLVILDRPDPQALSSKTLEEEEWQKANGIYQRDEASGWFMNKAMPEEWTIDYGDLSFIVKPSAFKHVGLFPEQAENWDWMRDLIKSNKKPTAVLNLFGYTGGASLACAQVGASVCHVDASKTAVEWGKNNAKVSNLADKPIRWLVDDAMMFVNRDINRGQKYDGIVMDPPVFGRGPKGQVWKIEDDLIPLLKKCFALLSEEPSFFLISGYAAGYSSLSYGELLEPLKKKYGGKIEFGELAIEQYDSDKLLPAGIFARWSKV